METIKASGDISLLFKEGKRYSTPYLTLIVSKRDDSTSLEGKKRRAHTGRVAFIAGKKLGNAVFRNSCKRRMRALCRDLGGPWDGYDMIFLAKAPLMEVGYHVVAEVCGKKIISFQGGSGRSG